MTIVADRVAAVLDPTAGHLAVREQAAAVTGRLVGHDLAVWATVDPATVMTTSCLLVGAARDPDLEAEVFAHEYGAGDDVLRYADLAAGPLVGTVHAATGGDPTRSARHRESVAPRGFTDHLRLVLSDGRTSWGVVDLLRADGAFTASEVATVVEAGRVVALGLRAAMLRARVQVSAVDGADPVVVPLEVEGSGLVLCDAAGRPVEVSDRARALLGGASLPPSVAAAVAGRRGRGEPVVLSAPDPAGRWLTFTATELGGHVAVVVEEIRPGRLADLVARARGLSSREQEVLGHLARGLSNRRIARELGLSEWTVQDHVKAVLAKFAAAGRAELLASLFTGHYAPLHAAG